MYLTIIIAVLIALGPAGSTGLIRDPALIFLCVLIVTALAPVPGVILSLSTRPEHLADAYLRARILRRLRIASIAYQVYLLVSFALVFYLAGWPWFVDVALGLRNWVLVDDLLRLLPFVAMLVLSWLPLYRIDRMLRRGTWSRREYIVFHFRQYVLFVLAPFIVIVTAADVFVMLPWSQQWVTWGVDQAAAVVGMIALYVFLPVMLRYIWKTRRMEDGPLRARLAALCERAGMKYSDILVWETMGGHIANACVTGITALARYVMITDGLMDALTPEEIEAVFAHEIGHIKRQHMTWYVLFAVAFLAVLMLGPPAAWTSATPPGLLAGLLSTEVVTLVVLVLLYWGVAFGFISRRMELEADLYAADLVGSTEVFVTALERISLQSGRPRSASGWRHFSIARRTQFLLDCASDPKRRARFHVGMTIMRWAIVVLAAGMVAAAALSVFGAGV